MFYKNCLLSLKEHKETRGAAWNDNFNLILVSHTKDLDQIKYVVLSNDTRQYSYEVYDITLHITYRSAVSWFDELFVCINPNCFHCSLK